MTHPIDAAKANLPKRRDHFYGTVWLSEKEMALLTQPDPRVTALVEAVKGSLGSVGYIGTSNELRAALAPFLKENQDEPSL